MLDREDKLTICFFGEAKPEDIHTVKWAKYFSDKSHNVHLFSYSDFGNNRVKEINLHLIKKKLPISLWPFNTIFNLPLTVLKIREIIKKIKPDIIHAHCVTSYGTLASLIGFHPFILTAWGSDILVNPQKSRFTRLSTKYVLKKADLITCDANHMKKAMVNLGADEEKIKVIYFGVDTTKFSPGVKNSALIKKWGFQENDKIIISLRSLEPIYSVETLIESVPLILKKIPDVKFVIAGKGSVEEKLKNMTYKLKIAESVRFVGWIDKDYLPDCLRTSDIYVSTSLSDGGLSSSTAEAMACGLPVVITASGENRLWVEDKKDGFVIPTKSPEILAEKIIYLIRNEEERKKFKERSLQIIQERNNYYIEMLKMEGIYKELIKSLKYYEEDKINLF